MLIRAMVTQWISTNNQWTFQWFLTKMPNYINMLINRYNTKRISNRSQGKLIKGIRSRGSNWGRNRSRGRKGKRSRRRRRRGKGRRRRRRSWRRRGWRKWRGRLGLSFWMRMQSSLKRKRKRRKKINLNPKIKIKIKIKRVKVKRRNNSKRRSIKRRLKNSLNLYEFIFFMLNLFF